MNIHSYSKVFNVGHPQIAELFIGNVIVEEKVDGSQFSFANIGGKLYCRSNGKDQTEYTDEMFKPALDTVNNMFAELKPNWVYRGELLNRPKHNTLCYGRVPKNGIIVFDVDTTGEGMYLKYPEKKVEAERLGFEVVPLIYEGEVKDIEMFRSFLERESVLGGCKIEGVVVKNYDRWTRDGKTMMGKYVSEDFKERNATDFRDRNPKGRDILDIVATEYKTDARWRKAVSHLRDKGVLLHEPKDIGALMQELEEDFVAECAEEIGQTLFKFFKRELVGKIRRGFPEWYKEQLLESAFPKEGFVTDGSANVGEQL